MLHCSSRAVSAGPAMFLCCRLEMEQEGLVSGVWRDLLSYLMNDWWHRTRSTFAVKCFLLHQWHSLICKTLCTHWSFLIRSSLYRDLMYIYSCVSASMWNFEFSKASAPIRWLSRGFQKMAVKFLERTVCFVCVWIKILRWILSQVTFTVDSRILTASFTCTKLITDVLFWFSLFAELQGKPGDHLSHRGLRSTGTGLFDLVTTATNSKPLCPPARPNSILFGWYLGHGTLLCLPTILICVSRDDDAQKIKPPSTQMNPCPDRPLLLLWWALDFALLPLPARFQWIPLLKVIAIVSIEDTWERHCVLCLYFWWIQHLVIHFRLSGKEKRLILKGTRLLGTKEMDQGEAHVCIWQDTNQAK